ncbi:hypothetical protein HispidOSU_028566 [Sigmodon hispidus]
MRGRQRLSPPRREEPCKSAVSWEREVFLVGDCEMAGSGHPVDLEEQRRSSAGDLRLRVRGHVGSSANLPPRLQRLKKEDTSRGRGGESGRESAAWATTSILGIGSEKSLAAAARLSNSQWQRVPCGDRGKHVSAFRGCKKGECLPAR